MSRDFDGRLLLNENPVCVEVHAPDNLLRSGGRSISFFGLPPDDEDLPSACAQRTGIVGARHRSIGRKRGARNKRSCPPDNRGS